MWTKSKCVAIYNKCRKKSLKQSVFENEDTQFKKVIKSINKRIKQQAKRGVSELDISRYEYEYFMTNDFSRVISYYADLGYELYNLTNQINICWEVATGR